MKKVALLTSLFLMLVTSIKAQTIEDVKKHLYNERYESAKKTLQTIINHENASPDAWYWLAEIHLLKKDIPAAEKTLQDGRAYFDKKGFSVKSYPLLNMGWAHLLLDKNDVAGAKAKIEETLKASKYKDASALHAAAKANIDSKNGDINYAIELLGKAIKRDKKNAELYVTLGDAYRKIIDGSNAIVNYRKAVEVNPAYAEAYYKAGRIYKSQKNIEIYLDRFTKAYEADSTYAPALYELYYHYFYRDLPRAEKLLNAYTRHADPVLQHEYMRTDLYYVMKKYKAAISGAENIFKAEKEKTQPRLYKLLAYSYAALGDSATALEKVNLYFDHQKASEYVVKDFELKARLLEKLNPDKSMAIEWYKKALSAEKDKKEQLNYMSTLAELQQEIGNRDKEAIWREKIYNTKEQPTNLDLYKWGLALYSDENYIKADSIFAIYEAKYPGQIFGYLWRARSNALIDSTMEKGLAVPHYKKLIEIASKDAEKNKSILLGAYGYLGTYEANVLKDFVASIGYFDKILSIEPGNSDASKYVEVLRKWIEEGKEEVNKEENKETTNHTGVDSVKVKSN